MSNKWLSSGRYGLTHGVFKRLWGPTEQLSEVIVPKVSRRPPSPGGGGDKYIMTELQEPLFTEAGEEVFVE